MPFKTLVNPRLGIVEIRHFGEVSISDAIYGRSNALELCKQHRLGKILLNIRAGKDVVSVIHAYTFVGSYIFSEASTELKVAVLVKQIHEDAKLIEVISNPRNLSLSIFEDSEAALEWLLG